MKRRVAAVVVVALTGMMLASLNAGAVGLTVNQKIGGTFRYMTPNDVTSLDPIGISFNQSGPDRYLAIFDALAAPDPKTGQIRPRLASSVTTPDKGLTWVIKLRSGVKFSDGTVLDANAVKFNWDRQADPTLRGVHQAAMSDLASYVVTDPQIITVALKQANTQWPNTLANELSFIGSPMAIRAAGAGFASKPVGAGAFVLESWTRGSQMVLARNASYHGPKPFLDKVVVSIQPDDAQIQNAFNASAVDGIGTGSDPVAESLRSRAGTVTVTPAYAGTGIGFDVTKAPFDDPDVRRAIILARDVQQIAATLGTTPLTAFFPKGSALYDPSLKFPKTDLAEAQKLINTYVAAHGGTALKVDFAYPTSAATDLFAQTLQAQLRRLNNVTITLNSVTAAAFNNARLAHQYSFFYVSLSGSSPEPTMYNTFHSRGGSNWFQYRNAAVDAALEKTRTGLNADSYKQAAAQIIKDNIYVGHRPSNSWNLVSKSIVLGKNSVLYNGTLDFATISFKKPS